MSLPLCTPRPEGCKILSLWCTVLIAHPLGGIHPGHCSIGIPKMLGNGKMTLVMSQVRVI